MQKTKIDGKISLNELNDLLKKNMETCQERTGKGQVCGHIANYWCPVCLLWTCEKHSGLHSQDGTNLTVIG